MSTTFLWAAGTSNNGLLVSPALPLMTNTELASLASTDTAVSSTTGPGSNGIINNSVTGQGLLGEVWLKLGAITGPLVAGALVSGWWLTSPDGGTTFEAPASNTAPPRFPDFIIPLPTGAIAGATSFQAQGRIVPVPALPFKIYVQNNLGFTLASSGNSLILALVAAIAQ